MTHIKPVLNDLNDKLVQKKDEKSYLQTQEAITSNPTLKFELIYKIAFATEEISELEKMIVEIKAIVD